MNCQICNKNIKSGQHRLQLDSIILCVKCGKKAMETEQ